MDWQRMVDACFGVEDNVFAGHESEKESARQMVAAAKAAGATRDDVVKEIVWRVYKRNPVASVYKNHLDQQVRALNAYWPA